MLVSTKAEPDFSMEAGERIPQFLFATHLVVDYTHSSSLSLACYKRMQVTLPVSLEGAHIAGERMGINAHAHKGN
jgi:hypothetical protein